MIAHTFRLFLVALFYGIIAYSIWFGLGTLAWYLYPDVSYMAHTRGEKIAGWMFTLIAGFLAARVHRPSPRWAVATSIAAAQVVQLMAAGVFVLRFGRQEYDASY